MFIFELVGWIDVLFAFCGFVICIHYSRLSDRMVRLVFAFGLMAFTHMAMRLVNYGLMAGFVPAGAMKPAFQFGGGILAASLGLLVFGILGVFQDVRERFHFIREMNEGRRQPAPGASAPDPDSGQSPNQPTVPQGTDVF